MLKVFTLKFFNVMGKALSGELSCLCDRSCCDSCGPVSNKRILLLYPNRQTYKVVNCTF